MRNWFARRTAVNHTADHSPSIRRSDRSRWMDALHVFVLTNFAVAQPVYDRLSTRSAFLVDLQLGYIALYALAATLTLALPASLVLLEWIVGKCRRSAYEILHLSVVWSMFVLLLLPTLKLVTFLPGSIVSCSAVIAAVAVSWCYSRIRQMRNVMTLAAPGILVFPVVFLLQATATLSTSLPQSSRSEKWHPVPVVMLVFDEFSGMSLMTPERQIDAVRFPNIAALAGQSTWFRNASSAHHMTAFAVPAILSGRYPFTFSAPSVGDLPQNVFSVLSHTGGYDVAAFEPVSRLAREWEVDGSQRAAGTWRQARYLADTLARVYLYHITPTDFASHLPVIPRSWFGVSNDTEIDTTQHRGIFRYQWGERRESQFQHFLECIDGSKTPTFHFQHLLLPHLPWCYLPSGMRYAPDGENWDLLELNTHAKGAEAGGDRWGSDELEVVQNQQRYLLQLMYLDRLIGRLVARLKETGQFDQCLLILTADHGISFRRKEPRRVLVPGNQDEILSIPLIIKRPGQMTGEVSDRIVETVDILPTIADVLGITLHGGCDGRSVFDNSTPPRTTLTYASYEGRTAVKPTVIANSKSPQVLHERFGDSAAPDAIYRVGPIPELIGTPISRWKQLSTPALDLTQIRYGSVVDVAAPVQVPSLYEGSIRTDIPLAESPVTLAVAINGTLRAVTRTYKQAGFLNHWAVMVPESAYHAGKNDVQFFRVTGTDPDWRLTPCVVHEREKTP